MIKKSTILLIEDDPMQIIMYELEFKNFGFKVLTANNSKDGFELAKSKKPDIILLDLLLGEDRGIDILKNIKTDLKTKELKVVIMTNFMKKGLAEECLGLGASDFIIKSDFTPKELVQKIESLI